MIKRIIKPIALTLIGLAIILSISTFILIWQLRDGPVSLTFLTPKLEDALSSTDADILVDIDDTVLIWTGWESLLEIRAVNLRGLQRDQLLLEIPEASLSFDPIALFTGIIKLRWLEIINPKITILRQIDGNLDLEFGTNPFNTNTGRFSIEKLVESWLESKLSGDSATITTSTPFLSVLASLDQISMVQAELTLNDLRTGQIWYFPDTSFHLNRISEGIVGWVELATKIREQKSLFSITADYQHKRQNLALTFAANFAPFNPSPIAFFLDQHEGMPEIVANIPVQLEGEVIIDFQHAMIRSAHFQATAGTGYLSIGSDSKFDLKLDSGIISASFIDTIPFSDLSFLADFANPAITRTSILQWQVALKPLRDVTIIEGDFAFELGNKNVRHPLGMQIHLNKSDPTMPINLQANLDRFVPADFLSTHPMVQNAIENWLPEGKRLIGLNAPISVAIVGLLSDTGAFKNLSVSVEGAAGQIVASDLWKESLSVEKFEISGSWQADTGIMQLNKSRLVLARGGQLQFQGTLYPENKDQSFSDNGGKSTQKLELTGRVTDLQIAAIETYWPQNLAINARKWIIANFVAGRFNTKMQASASLNTGGAIVFEKLNGDMSITEATVHYLRPLSPLRGFSVEGDYDLDEIRLIFASDGKVNVTNNQAGSIHLQGGGLIMSQLQTDQEQAEITAHFAGEISDILQLLDQPPFGYTSDFGLDPEKIDGSVQATLNLDFPLLNDLSMDKIAITVESQLDSVRIADVLADQSLEQAQLTLMLNKSGMQIIGTGQIDGVPVALDLKDRFRTDNIQPSYTRLYNLTTNLDAADLSRYGFDTQGWITGQIGLGLTYQIAARDNKPTFTLRADITEAQADLPHHLWHKAPGITGHIIAELTVSDQQITDIPLFEIRAADGTSITGTVILDQAKNIKTVYTSYLALGRTRLFDSSLRIFDDHIDLQLHGETLDIAPILGRLPIKTPPNPAHSTGMLATGMLATGMLDGIDLEPTFPWSLSIKATLDRLYFDTIPEAFTNVSIDIGHDGEQWRYIRILGNTSKGKKLRLEHDLDAYTNKKHPYLMRFASEDFGSFLHLIGANESLRGGMAILESHYEGKDNERQMTGRFEISDYALRQAPVVAHLFTITSFSGLVDLLSSREGIHFDGFETDFSYQSKRLALKNGRTWNNGIGITGEGWIDLQTDQLAIQGTIAPLYGISQALNWVPLLGDVLSPRRSGVFAANFDLNGLLHEPNIEVNPLSIVTPGFLRGFFSLFEDASDMPSPPPRPPKKQDFTKPQEG